MLKFKSFLASAAKFPALKDGEPVYLCIETYDGEVLVDKAIVTAKELTDYFGDSGYGINVVGYMTQDEVKDLTLEQRGLPVLTPPLERPKNVSPEIWDGLDRKMKAFVILHEQLHEQMAAYHAAIRSIYADLAK